MKTKKQKKAVVGYVRTANIPQLKDGISVNTQAEQIKEYCKAKGHKLTKMFSDNGCSGVNLQRPGIQELLAEVSAGKVSKVICLDSSRLSRKITDYLLLKSLLKKHGAEIVTISGVNTSDDCISQAIGEMMASLDVMHLKINRLRRSRSRKGK
jgi:site-specific DNA recombinase